MNTSRTHTLTNGNNTELEPGFCGDWLDAQHALFQLANLCMLISFLTPTNFKYHCFFLRIMLNFGFLLSVIWGAVFVCMTDIVIWNAIFLCVNSVHLVYLGYKVVPERFPKALEDVYSHTFKPLKVTRKQFKEITDFGSMQVLGKGAVYAKQDQTKTGQKLSILLKGRLKVTYDDCFLHSIELNHFVDSPEFDNSSVSCTEDTFKVSVSVVEDSLIFTWPQDQLINYLSHDPILRHIFRQLIGKDISHKLYEIQERLMANPSYMDGINTRRSSMVNVRHGIVSNSTSNLAKLNCLQGQLS
ncbi:blood vessel epicardial substance-like [Mercenaria mercenaria]|uniref:blood vessel epicardial substance-like n=1 Tax=Mercenaria mercenaria TaxID=6596 RepID=UPI00234F4864|nr:blood vessel epicardial substance-like [Mercenaria mercenaria]